MDCVKIRRAGNGLLPRRGRRVQPGVSTPGTYRPKRRALKGRKIEHGNNRQRECNHRTAESLAPDLLNLVFSTERRMLFPQSAEVGSDLYVLRPFRANRLIGYYPGLKPRAESCSPFGAKNHPKMPFYPRHWR